MYLLRVHVVLTQIDQYIYLNSLKKLQKRSVRVITHSHFLSHTEPLFSKLNIHPF